MANHLPSSPEFRFVIAYFKGMDFTSRELYANWLAQTYYFVSHSVRLSALGASRLDVDHPLAKRMVAHTREEAGHHLLARRDIEVLGKDLKDYPVLGLTSAFYQAQYYKVLFEDPSHLIGQILMLESVSVEVGAWLLQRVETHFGADASRFVEVHAKDDHEHVRRAIATVAELPAGSQAGIAANFMQACEMYFFILRSIQEDTFAQLVKRAT